MPRAHPPGSPPTLRTFMTAPTGNTRSPGLSSGLPRRGPSRPPQERTVMAVDNRGPLFAWAVVRLPAAGAPGLRPRYLQHGQVQDPGSPSDPRAVRVRAVLADLLAAYSPVLLVLTTHPGLREATPTDPYAFLSDARRRGIGIRVVLPGALPEALPGALSGTLSCTSGSATLESFHGLRASPSPEGAARALASATAAALELWRGPAYPNPPFGRRP